MADPDKDIEKFTRRLSNRARRIIDYATESLAILIIWAVALLADYALFQLLWALWDSQIEKFPLVAIALDLGRVLLGIMFIIGGVIHGLFSLYGQIKMDWELFVKRKDEEQ